MNEPVISILDDLTANQIAAGEVVERPAAIVKELLENSIDAGSTELEVEITGGGIESIRVTDNGIGMSPKNLELAVLRHATSKIKEAKDLHQLQTLGFRGEALPSIAAVSKFTLTSRPAQAELGAKLIIHGGTVLEVTECGSPPGTTVLVEDLFYNTPARKKFLKTVNTESSQIHDVLTRLSLAYPNIRFRLTNQKRMVLATPGVGDLKETVASLYGAKVISELLAVQYENEDLRVEGYISKPSLLRGSRQWQTFLVNQRVIQNRAMARAVDQAYHSLLPKSGYPLAVIEVFLPVDQVDVNVHPQKAEVKFTDEQKIFKAIYQAVKLTLEEINNPSELATPVSYRSQTHFHQDRSERSAVETLPFSFRKDSPSYDSPAPGNWAAASLKVEEENVSLIDAQQMIQEHVTIPEREAPSDQKVNLQPLGQIDNLYIIAQGDEGLYIVDQHAAHERILYDKFSEAAERIPSQQLLVPIFLEVSEIESQRIQDYQELFDQMGFTIEPIGPHTYRLLESPSDIPADEAEAYVRSILDLLANLQQPTPQLLRHACLQLAACHGAIRAGQPLHMRQMQILLQELCATSLPYTCPHGRPVIIRFSPAELGRLFKRT